jgi:hypothetical protein
MFDFFTGLGLPSYMSVESYIAVFQKAAAPTVDVE